MPDWMALKHGYTTGGTALWAAQRLQLVQAFTGGVYYPAQGTVICLYPFERP